MRLRLTHYEGSPPSLSPGWYELPPHLPASEIGRLLDLLATMLDGVVDIVQCSWLELERLGTRWGPDTLVHVAIVPGEVDVAQRDATLRGLSPRLGLFSHARAGHRDASAWLETTIKSALAAWLRRTLRRPEHPLAALGVAALPLDMLIAATSEPVELLELVEHALELAIEHALDGESIDWTGAVRHSLGRRLGQRLSRVRPAWLPELLHRLTTARSTTLRRLDEPAALDELVRVGLAITGQGEVLLAPLARLASAPDIADMLEREGLHARAPVQPAVVRERATSPAAAARAFDPLLEVRPGEPWFVDLDAISPMIRGVGLRLRNALLKIEGHARVVLVRPPGLGIRTMLGKWVRGLAARGLVVVRVPVEPRRTPEGLMIAMRVALLEHALAEAVDEEARSLVELRLKLARETRALESARSPLWVDTNLRASLLWELADDVQEFAGRERSRGRVICLLVDDPAGIEMLSEIETVAFSANVVVETSVPVPRLAGVEFIGPTEVSLKERRSVVSAIMSARAELDRVFAEPDRVTDLLVARTSRIRRALTIAGRACVAGEGLVSSEQIARAAPLRLLYLWAGAVQAMLAFEQEHEQLIASSERAGVELAIRPVTSLERLTTHVFGNEPDVLHISWGMAATWSRVEIAFAGPGPNDAGAFLEHLELGLRYRVARPCLIVLATSDCESLLGPLTAFADVAIGFAGQVTDDVARESMLAFYERAFAGATLDAALAHAREVADRWDAGAGARLIARARPEIDTATYVLRPSPVAQQPE